MRIAHVVGDMVGGGVEAVIMNYYRHVDKEKIQFDFIIHEHSTHVPVKEIEELGGRIYYVPSYKQLSAYKKALYKIFKENRYAVVHSHMNTLSVFPLKVAKKAGVKTRIAHSHSTSNKKEWKRNLIKNLLRPYSKKYATHYFACSELAGRWLFGDKAFDEGKVTVINNAIDLEKFRHDEEKRLQLRKSLNSENDFVIGHVGRFVTQKNHAFLLDVFREVQKDCPNARLLLLGDGPLMQEIRERVESLHLSDRVIFVGSVTNPQDYYNAMDCFVLPSLYEGLPVVGIEAQINGLTCFFSTAMTQETKILSKTRFFDLKDDLKTWAEAIENGRAEEPDRKSAYEEFRTTKYDIVSESKKLEQFYVALCEK